LITLPTLNAANAISVTATDTAQIGGNISVAQTATIIHDNIKPVVGITAPVIPAGGLVTKNNKPVLTFSVTEVNPAFTTVRVDGSTTPINPTPVSGEALVTALPDGLRTLRVEATDKAGNVDFNAVVLTIDTKVAPFTLTPVTTPTNVLSQTIGGTIEAGSTVLVKVGAAAPLPATVTGTDWKFPIAALVDGPNAISVTATDTLGNIATPLSSSINIIQHDGKIAGAASVTISDALKSLQFASGLTTPTPDEKFRADVAPLVNGIPTGDGKVNIGDVVLILRKAAGLPSF
jgi:hypothetical protein